MVNNFCIILFYFWISNFIGNSYIKNEIEKCCSFCLLAIFVYCRSAVCSYATGQVKTGSPRTDYCSHWCCCWCSVSWRSSTNSQCPWSCQPQASTDPGSGAAPWYTNQNIQQDLATECYILAWSTYSSYLNAQTHGSTFSNTCIPIHGSLHT